MNPVAYTEKVLSSFLRYQLTRYPFADAGLYAQMRKLLSLEATRHTPLLKGPYVSLSRSFRRGASVADLVAAGILHPFLENLVEHPHVYGHQEKAFRAIVAGQTTLVSTGTGSGKTECFLYPIISRCLKLRDDKAPPGIAAVLIYPMNALAEDQLGRLRGLLAGSGITFGMYVGRTPNNQKDVVGERLPVGASRADYGAAVKRAREELRDSAVHPAEERCSREEMRTPGGQPRILITNVKQLELLLTRQADVELFDGARLEFLVCDEAHTFSGANGAETACLVRRLRAFCGKEITDTTCIATSATIADPSGGAEAGRAFASRFFGVPAEAVALVSEEYAPDVWREPRAASGPLPGNSSDHLRAVLASVDTQGGGGAQIVEAFAAMTGDTVDGDRWEEDLFDRLAGNEVVYQIASSLDRARALRDLLEDLEKRLGRPLPEEEVLAWLVLGAAARAEGRPLLRPVVHAFVRGVSGAVVTFPEDDAGPRLWLSAEDERAAGVAAARLRLPVLNCTTCGQHYFEHYLEDFDYTTSAPGGGQAHEDRRVWLAKAEPLGGRRLLLVDRVVGADEDDDEPARTTELFLCRACGAGHPGMRERCDGCGLEGLLIRLLAMGQKPDQPGKLTRCVSCSASGRVLGSRYLEPIRPVRAVTVADVHVLAQDMVHHAERRRLLVFADNRQDAAFQAGWMRDHARRFRLRAMMAERINQGAVSIGDLTAFLDEALEKDDDLSRVLIPEVWDVHRKEAEGVKHADERKRYLRIQVLREITTGVKQTIGLEPWGRMRPRYRGLDAEAAFIQEKAASLGVPASDLADGVGVLLDLARRRSMLLLDRDGEIFTRFWQDGDFEVSRGYLPKLPGVPKGLKLRRSGSDDTSRVSQWTSHTAHLTNAREMARSWGVAKDDVDAFLGELWRFLVDDLQLLVPVTLKGARGNALPKCSGVFQIDADLLRLEPRRELYRCRKCHRAQVRRTPHLACPAWHCDGQLEPIAENPDSYDLSILDEGVEMIRPREHSAQVPPDERDRIERLFKGKSNALNTLVCTPTLELGVDIGELDTVLMRNVPPLPSNYWQRVGRAGRRHRMAVNISYARPLSHDQIYFADPLKMLDGRIDPPRFNLRNDQMVRKHVHASILTRLHQLARPTSAGSDADRNEVSLALETIFPAQIRGYLFKPNGELLTAPFDVRLLRTVISKHATELDRYVAGTFSQGWPPEDSAAVTTETLERYVKESADRLDGVIRRFRKRLNWALHQISRLSRERDLKGTLEPMEDMLFRRCDGLIKRMKGLSKRTRRSDEGIDDTNTYAALAAEGFLPGYGLEIGAVIGTAQLPRHIHGGREFDLRRATAVAIREYIPGNLIYANGQKFIPRFFRLEPEVEPTYFIVDIGAEAVRESGAVPAAGPGSAAAGLGAREIRAIEMCDVELPHSSHITDDEEFRFQLGVSVFGHEKGRWNGGKAYRWGARDLLHRLGVHVRLVNVGAARLLSGATPKLGYPMCLVCGHSRSPFASKKEHEHFEKDHLERCAKPIESTGFYADDVSDAISLPHCASRGEAYSVLEALRTGASHVLEMETEDLEILVIGRSGSDEVDGLLLDPMPGGSGLLDQLCARFDEVVAAAVEVVSRCPSDCARACIDCLCRFRNAFFHKHLDRYLAEDRLRAWGERLELSHDIPANLPTADLAGELPVNQAEAALGLMLERAGFPATEWHHQIDLGRPLGTTSPDCYYADEDSDEAGICVYLDGLSEHIHGNPTTAQRDRAIREKLRADGYEVIEIVASDLFDRDKMARHFFRLGKYLVGKEKARELRDDPRWFEPPVVGKVAAAVDELVPPPVAAEASEVVLPFRIVEGKPEERYRTCVPLQSLAAAAGGFGASGEVEVIDWVEPSHARGLGDRMFVARVVGHSMEPRIPDGAYCLFRGKPVAGSRGGRILLVQHRDISDPETGGSYTVKKWDSSGVTGKSGEERRGTIFLNPENPEFKPIELNNVAEGEVDVVAELLEVLGRLPPTPSEPADSELEALLAEVDESCRPLLRACRERGLPLPVVGDEIVGDAGRVVAEAELCWRDERVAVLVAGYTDEKEACEHAGWVALLMPVTASDVAAAFEGRRSRG